MSTPIPHPPSLPLRLRSFRGRGVTTHLHEHYMNELLVTAVLRQIIEFTTSSGSTEQLYIYNPSTTNAHAFALVVCVASAGSTITTRDRNGF